MLDFEVGDILAGKYEIKKVLGAGGMGKVFRARQVDLGRDVALKVPSQAVLESPEVMARFSREAKTVAKLMHDNIVQVYEYHHEGDLAFIAMEFVEGDDLKGFTHSPPPDLTVGDISRILQHSCEGIACAHEHGIVHRDIKPHNIMVARLPRGKWRVKVMDFGIAHVDTANQFTEMGNNQLTQEGQALGTPSYMAPEQIRGAGVSHLSDLYSFGCVIYYVFTQQTVFTGSGLTVAVAHLNEQPPSIRTRLPGMPEALDQLILRCLEKDPARRPQDAHEIGQMIEAALGPLASMPMTEIWRQTMQAPDATIPIIRGSAQGATGKGLIEVQTQQTIPQTNLPGAGPIKPAGADATAKITRMSETNIKPGAVSPARPEASAGTAGSPPPPSAGVGVAPPPETSQPASAPAKENRSFLTMAAVLGVLAMVVGIGGVVLFGGDGKNKNEGNAPGKTPVPSPTAVASGTETPATGTATPEGTPATVATSTPNDVAVVVPKTPTPEARQTPVPTPEATPSPTPDPLASFARRLDTYVKQANNSSSPIGVGRAWMGVYDLIAEAPPEFGEQGWKAADALALSMAMNPSLSKVAAGTFTMGSDTGAPDEGPAHNVTITNDYMLGLYEVTALEFCTFLNAEKEKARSYFDADAMTNIQYDEKLARYIPKKDRALHPANGISWEAANDYTKWLQGTGAGMFRLPTEAEWEFAAAGKTKLPYPNGNEAPSQAAANFGGKDTVPVDRFESPASGFYSLGGNVSEWCSDWFSDQYYLELKAQTKTTDPRGPEASPDLSRKVLRGGGFQSEGTNELRCTARGRELPGKSHPDVGFRLVKETEAK